MATNRTVTGLILYPVSLSGIAGMKVQLQGQATCLVQVEMKNLYRARRGAVFQRYYEEVTFSFPWHYRVRVTRENRLLPGRLN